MVREAALIISPATLEAETNAQYDEPTIQTAVVPAGWHKACNLEMLSGAGASEPVVVSVAGCLVNFGENTDTALFLKVVKALGAIS
jgi:hypothetical protein